MKLDDVVWLAKTLANRRKTKDEKSCAIHERFFVGRYGAVKPLLYPKIPNWRIMRYPQARVPAFFVVRLPYILWALYDDAGFDISFEDDIRYEYPSFVAPFVKLRNVKFPEGGIFPCEEVMTVWPGRLYQRFFNYLCNRWNPEWGHWQWEEGQEYEEVKYDEYA